MAMAETTRQSDALPPLSYLDLEKIKRESSLYNPKLPSSAPIIASALPLVSPSSMYSGPPPPYSYPSSTASSVVGGHNGYISPSEPRRTEEDKEPAHQANRQSLPSIHEALNREPLSITSLISQTSAPPPQPSHQSSHRSPTTPVTKSYTESALRGPPVTLSQSQPPVTYPEVSRPQYSPRLPVDLGASHHPTSNAHEARFAAMQPPRTVSSPIHTSRPSLPASHLRHSSPAYESIPRHTPVMNPPHTYSSHPTSYSYAAPMSTIVSSYQPQASPSYPTWRYGDSDSERTEEVRRATAKESPVKQAFGEAIKRHLDSFDLETSLNEIAEGSGRALEFSRVFGSRAHQTQRSGPIPGSLPELKECDDMIGYQTRVLDSMHRIKDVIIAQQHALAEQRNYEQAYKHSGGNEEDGIGFHEKLEGAGGFAGADPKKRRGRAAPPGRCHSCNRAETPEWRRGPDGARTLCNACGLHYAKLTRKINSKPSASGSNLRPKEMNHGSPSQ
ncbi:MAG: hypothetical protein Q9167_008071 [Letrouitia subvulpina]